MVLVYDISIKNGTIYKLILFNVIGLLLLVENGAEHYMTPYIEHCSCVNIWALDIGTTILRTLDFFRTHLFWKFLRLSFD